MHWYFHLFIHYLDLLRHETISTMAWEPVKTNIGAGVWWAVIVATVTSIVYPTVRRAIEAFVKRHIKSEHEELHNKLNHIIKHHPDIPNLEKEE